jgi:hypothetical protein
MVRRMDVTPVTVSSPFCVFNNFVLLINFLLWLCYAGPNFGDCVTCKAGFEIYVYWADCSGEWKYNINEAYSNVGFSSMCYGHNVHFS